MTGSNEEQSRYHAITKGARLNRIRKVNDMIQSGKSRVEVSRELGIPKATLKKYIDDFYLLDGSQGSVKAKPQPKIRKCLHCQSTFRPPAIHRFMCDNCNNFARGAML